MSKTETALGLSNMWTTLLQEICSELRKDVGFSIVIPVVRDLRV